MVLDVYMVLEIDMLCYLMLFKSWIVLLICLKNLVIYKVKVLDFVIEMNKYNKILDFVDSIGDCVGVYFYIGGIIGMLKVV